MKPNNGSEHKKGIGHYMYVAYSASYNALLSRYMKAIKRFIKKASYAWILLGVFCLAGRPACDAFGSPFACSLPVPMYVRLSETWRLPSTNASRPSKPSIPTSR